MYKPVNVDTLPTIPEFFKNREIFITGGSGFMGKALIEKLLHACPEVGNIYVLLRKKKGKDINERLESFKKESIFDRLYAEKKEKLLEKIIPVAGDVAELGLAMSDADKKLIENVQIFFHVAASVRFDDPLKEAILMNTRGTREVVKLAETLKKLKVMMHVSTTYCNPDWKVIEEKIYPPLADWKQAIKIAENVDVELLDILALKYSSFQPNTYTFTKSLSEQIINENKDKLPLIIFRPSIVISSVSEPMAGWIDNYNGPVGLLVGCGFGINRTLYSNPNNVADYTPVDIAIRAMLTAVWKRGTQEPIDKLQIYNCCTSDVKPTTFSKIVNMGKDLAPRYPFNRIIWAPGGDVTNWKFINYYRVILYHVLPAILIDQIFKLSGNRPFVLKLQRKIYHANQALAYFILNVWEFKNRNLYSLSEGMKESDKFRFQFDYEIPDIEVIEYFAQAIYGARKYLIKEKDEDLPMARIRFRRMQVLDKVCKTIIVLLVGYYLIKKFALVDLIAGYFSNESDSSE